MSDPSAAERVDEDQAVGDAPDRTQLGPRALGPDDRREREARGRRQAGELQPRRGLEGERDDGEREQRQRRPAGPGQVECSEDGAWVAIPRR